jgi:hypothetical protein
MQQQQIDLRDRLARTWYERYQLGYVFKAREPGHFGGYLLIYLVMGGLGLVFGRSHLSLWGWVYLGVAGPITLFLKRAVARLLTEPTVWREAKGLEGLLWRMRRRWPHAGWGMGLFVLGMGIVISPLVKGIRLWEASLIVGMVVTLVATLLQLGELYSRFLVRLEEGMDVSTTHR